MTDRTRDGRKFRLLNIIDEFTQECLAIRGGRKRICPELRRPVRTPHRRRGKPE
jgi:hypothetical protein